MEANQHRIAEAVVAATRARRAAEADQLAAIAEFAEAYRVDVDALVPVLAERRRRIGAVGTPSVSEFAALELAGLLGCSAWAAGHRMIEALDLKHRHPALFEAALGLEVEVFRATRAASICADLSPEAAEQVMNLWLPRQERLGWRAAFTLLERLVIEADQQLAARKEAEARRSRGVRVWGLEHGCLQLAGSLDVLDGRYFDQSLDRMAALLEQDHPELTSQERRAKAVGVLANPALALAMLQRDLQPRLVLAADASSPVGGAPGNGRSVVAGPVVVEPVAVESGVVVTGEVASGLVECGAKGAVAGGSEVLDCARVGSAMVGTESASTAWDGADHARCCCGMGDGDGRGPRRALGGDPADLQWSDPHREPSGHLCGTIGQPLRTLVPRLSLAVHIHSDALGSLTGAARIDRAGWITTHLLSQLLGEVQLTVQPVIDLANTPVEDDYLPRVGVRRALELAMPTEMFAYSNCRSQGLDIDHSLPYRAGEIGQTRIGNLVPLGRRVHRAKTVGAWSSRQRGPDRVEWTSPLGYSYEVTPDGTTRLTE